jgi:hypothetical protein
MFDMYLFDIWLQWAFREIIALQENFTRFLRTLQLPFNELTEGFEVGRASITHELEGDALACLDENAFSSQAVESKGNFKGVAGRDTICDDVNFVEFMLHEGESRLKDADVGLPMDKSNVCVWRAEEY